MKIYDGGQCVKKGREPFVQTDVTVYKLPFFVKEMESYDMSEDDDCPPVECDIICFAFLKDDYGCKRCACDRTNPGK